MASQEDIPEQVADEVRLLMAALAYAFADKLGKRGTAEFFLAARIAVTQGGADLVDGLADKPDAYQRDVQESVITVLDGIQAMADG